LAQLAAFSPNDYLGSEQLSTTNAQQRQGDMSQALAELDSGSKPVAAALKQQRQITLLQQGQNAPFTSKRTSQGKTL